jgi:hypothetical protein
MPMKLKMKRKLVRLFFTLIIAVSASLAKAELNLQEQQSGPNLCQCKFSSKHYTWDNSNVPKESQVPLFQFTHKFNYKKWSYTTSSVFRCVYKCTNTFGDEELVEYVHPEERPGYYTGGLTAAKLFNCRGSTPSFTRRGTYYETKEALPFSPYSSNIRELINWATENKCKE